MIYGLTYLGVIHTLVSLVAVFAALLSFGRHKGIVPGNTLGKLYIWTTVLTCVSGFGIFQHGGFGKPHVLGIVTLLVLGLAWLADQRKFGAKSAAVSTVSYSLTFFFHMIPAVTETTTRLPYGNPWLPSHEAPELKTITGVMFLLLVVGVALQLRRLKKGAAAGPNLVQA
ncbi:MULTISPECIES: hypothetical protein [unclassified Duganella]|uniref:hypothetical protein n=1 Tax=unclassified Duganella TaxID=2636909 RepID=UPI00088870D7|nr:MULTISPECIES: hypothetical protein [unclassified Duganella]SDH16733.1 hypothetical protein SAMN05216320_110131 [Duganella sp. OV458]SDK31281.1 hypothetical protein SAMN05428973_110131 [Duganella sp. OV510]